MMALSEEERNRYYGMFMEAIMIGLTEYYMDKYRTAVHLEKSAVFEKALNPHEQIQFKREKDDIVERATEMMACFAMIADDEGVTFEKAKEHLRETFLNSLNPSDDNVNIS